MGQKVPISDVLELHCSSLIDGSELTPIERWRAIQKCKEEFLKNGIVNPDSVPCMQQEVVDSWKRSRNKGVNPYEIVTTPNFKETELSKILKQKQSLIKIVDAQLKPFKEQIISCGYFFFVFEKTGLILLSEGDWSQFPSQTRPTSRQGILADENTEGTTAHELCFRLNRPVLLLGPEHYCTAFHDRIASAAPILDDHGEATAALVILSPPLLDPLRDDAGDEVINNLSFLTMGFITSMASSVSAQLQLAQTSSDLCEVNEKTGEMFKDLQVAKDKIVNVHKTLAASWTLVEDAIVAVDECGKILQINQGGLRILKVRPDEIGNRNINEFFNNSLSIIELAQEGKHFSFEEFINVGNERKKPYKIDVVPVLNQYTKKLEVVVLKFVACEKAATQRSKTGCVATFTFEDIIGESKEIKNTIALAQRFSDSPENVLLIGESGTGKELFAQAIHNTYRPNGPFMAVNCASLPRELVGSELFGYEGGSFTGAERCGKPGKIELAHGGTLFLDEIGDMPLDLQAVLLRTLQDKHVMRIGASRCKEVDFRLIAATNKDLVKMVKERQFREDLYYRISVLTVDIPPLRERSNDVELLSKTFVEKYCRKQGWETPQLSPETLKIINEYHWPGNVRQLQNAIHHSINTVNGSVISPKNLPKYILMDSSPVKIDEISNFSDSEGDNFCLKKIEKAAIEAALLRANNCIPTAAEMVGLSRSTLYRKLKEYKINVA